MSDNPYRAYAAELALLSRKVQNQDVAGNYRRIAVAYIALARFRERADRYRGAIWLLKAAPETAKH